MKAMMRLYGIWIGVAISAVFLVSHLAAGDPPDFGMMEIVGWVGMIVSMLAIFFAVKTYRDKVAGSVMSFGTGFKLGMGISVIAGLVLGLYTFGHILLLDPDFGDEYIAYEISNLEQSGVAGAELQEQIDALESQRDLYNSPLFQGLIMAVTVLLLGLVMSLIAALVFKSSGGTRQVAME
jgi:hypothetical protein